MSRLRTLTFDEGRSPIGEYLDEPLAAGFDLVAHQHGEYDRPRVALALASAHGCGRAGCLLQIRHHATFDPPHARGGLSCAIAIAGVHGGFPELLAGFISPR
jgi:hypothetical protein